MADDVTGLKASRHIERLRAALVVVCLATAVAVAQTPPEAQPQYGATVRPDSFSYRRDIGTGAPGPFEVQLDAAVLAHTRTGFADLRIITADGRQVPYVVEQQQQRRSIQLAMPRKEDASPARRTLRPWPSSHHPAARARDTITRYAVSLPYSHLPAAQLVLTTTARVFEREVWVEVGPGEGADRPDADWRIVGTAWWSHADAGSDPPPLTFDIPSLRTTVLHIAVDEGDNAALPLARPVLLLPSYRVRFIRPTGVPLQLVYGNRDVEQPRYDLALVARSLLDSPATVAALGPERPAPAHAIPAGVMFWSALVCAVMVLLALIVHLVRKA